MPIRSFWRPSRQLSTRDISRAMKLLPNKSPGCWIACSRKVLCKLYGPVSVGNDFRIIYMDVRRICHVVWMKGGIPPRRILNATRTIISTLEGPNRLQLDIRIAKVVVSSLLSAYLSKNNNSFIFNFNNRNKK